jgi:putative transposase
MTEAFLSDAIAHFLSLQTEGHKAFFRQEQWARILISILKRHDGEEYKLHAYVAMPDHLHVLMTPFGTVEKAVQPIRDEFSQRAKSEMEWNRPIWEPGFTDHPIRDEEDWLRHMEYIQRNPVEGRLVSEKVQYEFMGFPDRALPAGLKAAALSDAAFHARGRTVRD